MHTTIIFAHPWHGSFNKAILDIATQTLAKNNTEYRIIDLNKDNFNPAMTGQELALYNKGAHLDPLVEKYHTILDNTDEVILIFPIWWCDMPAVLKGFFDKVMLKGAAYTEGNTGLLPIWNIKKTTVITTSQSPTHLLTQSLGDPIGKVFIPNTLNTLGMKHAAWLNCGKVKSITSAEREAFLSMVASHING